MVRTLGVAFLISMTAVMVACGGKAADTSTATASSESGSTPTSPTVSDSIPLALHMYTIYSTTNSVNNLKFQESGTVDCNATTGSPTPTCTVIVPEGRLYYSDLYFQFSRMTDKCKLLTFQPYYYKASTSATYTAPGAASSIDCSGSTVDASGNIAAPPADCYGGAARWLVSGFPQYAALIYLPNEAITSGPQDELPLTLTSAFSHHTGSNRLTANDLASGNVGNTYSASDLGGAGDGYVANSFVNYSLTCRDDWYDPETYTITLKVTDQDSATGSATTVDDYWTWDEQ